MSNDTELDIKDCCGAFAEIGSIIRPDDTELAFSITANDKALLEAKKDKISAYIAETFSDVKAEFVADSELTYNVTVSFGVTAEKMIFEMNLRHLMA